LESKMLQPNEGLLNDLQISPSLVGATVSIIRSAIDKKKPFELRTFLKGFIRKIVVAPDSINVQYNPLYMIMSNKPGSSLYHMLAPRAGLEPAT
jgi:hypothetical protein